MTASAQEKQETKSGKTTPRPFHVHRQKKSENRFSRLCLTGFWWLQLLLRNYFSLSCKNEPKAGRSHDLWFLSVERSRSLKEPNQTGPESKTVRLAIQPLILQLLV